MTQSSTDLNRYIFDSNDSVAESIAEQWRALSKRGETVHISLSGGSTPKHIFGYIAHSDFANDIAWQSLHFWWGDERCVPAIDAQSNYGEAMRLLFSQVLIPAENLHPIHGELSPEKACIEFKSDMAAYLPKKLVNGKARPVFDWIILGVGEDGHTASLFPGYTDYQASENAFLAHHPETQQVRVTLSAPAICSAKRITYLALGEAKKNIIDRLHKCSSMVEHLPAAKLKSNEGKTEWYLDQASAAGLN